MFHSDDDFDDDLVQVANDVDEDFLLASQVHEMEQDISRIKSQNEEKDFELALKLSNELNNNNSIKNNLQNSPSSSPVSLRSSFGSNTQTLVQNSKDSDYLLAVRLSRADYHSPPRNPTKISFDDHDTDFDEVMTNNVDSDFLLAIQLSQSDSSPKSRKVERGSTNVSSYLNKSISVVDPSWETIDPNPDIYSLFIAFNKRFFWGKLDMVEVKWSPRMTLCAGICSYQKRAGHCTVKLSKPLLQLRPRKDLVETLLHEMIHAYLFVTHNDRDRDGHGPQFHSHMYRINKDSGANITVYHSFHDEVRFYKKHEWQCQGPCRRRPPYFGIVRRATNRAPGPNDLWWSDHAATCGGNFIKTKEPEDYPKKKTAAERKKESRFKETGGIPNYFKVPPSKTNVPASIPLPTPVGTSMAVKTSTTNVSVSTPAANKRIFTLSDLANNKRSPTKSPSGSPKKWVPLPGQRNILQFVNK